MAWMKRIISALLCVACVACTPTAATLLSDPGMGSGGVRSAPVFTGSIRVDMRFPVRNGFGTTNASQIPLGIKTVTIALINPSLQIEGFRRIEKPSSGDGMIDVVFDSLPTSPDPYYVSIQTYDVNDSLALHGDKEVVVRQGANDVAIDIANESQEIQELRARTNGMRIQSNLDFLEVFNTSLNYSQQLEGKKTYTVPVAVKNTYKITNPKYLAYKVYVGPFEVYEQKKPPNLYAIYYQGNNGSSFIIPPLYASKWKYFTHGAPLSDVRRVQSPQSVRFANVQDFENTKWFSYDSGNNVAESEVPHRLMKYLNKITNRNPYEFTGFPYQYLEQEHRMEFEVATLTWTDERRGCPESLALAMGYADRRTLCPFTQDFYDINGSKLIDNGSDYLNTRFSLAIDDIQEPIVWDDLVSLGSDFPREDAEAYKFSQNLASVLDAIDLVSNAFIVKTVFQKAIIGESLEVIVKDQLTDYFVDRTIDALAPGAFDAVSSVYLDYTGFGVKGRLDKVSFSKLVDGIALSTGSRLSRSIGIDDVADVLISRSVKGLRGGVDSGAYMLAAIALGKMGEDYLEHNIGGLLKGSFSYKTLLGTEGLARPRYHGIDRIFEVTDSVTGVKKVIVVEVKTIHAATKTALPRISADVRGLLNRMTTSRGQMSDSWIAKNIEGMVFRGGKEAEVASVVKRAQAEGRFQKMIARLVFDPYSKQFVVMDLAGI